MICLLAVVVLVRRSFALAASSSFCTAASTCLVVNLFHFLPWKWSKGSFKYSRRKRPTTLPSISANGRSPMSALKSRGEASAPSAVSRFHLRSVSYTHLRAHETDSYLVC